MNNAVCSALFGHLILHFALPGSIILVKIWSTGAVWGYFGFWLVGVFLPFSPFPQFIFLVVLGYFWLYMWMYACGYVCIHWRPNWKTVLFIHLLPAVEIKQIFAFVPQFFPPNHRTNEKYLEFKIWRDVGGLFLTCLVNCHLLFFGFKMSGDFFATSFMLG